MAINRFGKATKVIFLVEITAGGIRVGNGRIGLVQASRQLPPIVEEDGSRTKRFEYLVDLCGTEQTVSTLGSEIEEIEEGEIVHKPIAGTW